MTDPLLQPFTLKHLTLRNRVMSTSHACGLEEDGGMPAEISDNTLYDVYLKPWYKYAQAGGRAIMSAHNVRYQRACHLPRNRSDCTRMCEGHLTLATPYHPGTTNRSGAPCSRVNGCPFSA